jgi:hypothetical protein
MWNRLKEYLFPPIFEGNEDKTRIARLINTIVLTLLAAFALYALASPVLAPGRAYRVILTLVNFPMTAWATHALLLSMAVALLYLTTRSINVTVAQSGLKSCLIARNSNS